jgi:hypothetical protein
MDPLPYAVRITRRIGRGGTTLFEVEARPLGGVPGQAPEERVSAVILEPPDTTPERLIAKARKLLTFVATADWSLGDDGKRPEVRKGGIESDACCELRQVGSGE